MNELKASPRFLVAVDAYRSGACTLEQMLRLAFTGPPYIPRDLHPLAFARLVLDLAEDMRLGLVAVGQDDKDRYKDFYTVQPEE